MTENLFSKTIIAATIKLNDNKSFRAFFGAQRKVRHLLDDPLKENDEIM